MQEIGLVKSEERGNRLYYMLNTSYDFYYDLLTLVSKTTGLGREIKHTRKKLGDLRFVMFSGSFARSKPHKNTDVDILVIGSVVIPELSALIKAEEEKRGHEINYTVMTAEEFDFRKARRDPFLRELLEGSRIMIIGDEDSFLETKPQLAT
jgi:predicted nucleotidyltransferase